MRNFDRVAHLYDATRELPAPITDRIADRVVAATRATPETGFLEVGVGTGRIALPFLQRGYRYTGVDISERMMDRLRAKIAGTAAAVTLVNADAEALPFADDTFEVVIGVHIFHLVPDWRRGLSEARRVLTPNGHFVLGYENTAHDDPGNELRRQWQTFVREAGGDVSARAGIWPELEAAMTAAGAYSAAYRVGQWEEELVPRTVLAQQRERVYSHSWEVPEAVLEAAHERMERWTAERFGSLDTVLTSQREFVVTVHRFPTTE